MLFDCSYKHLLAFDYKRADNQTFDKRGQKVIEETLNRIAVALESIASSMITVTTPVIEIKSHPVEETTPKQKAGPGRPRKYPRPEDGAKYPESTAAAPVAADQPEVSEVSNTGSSGGVDLALNSHPLTLSSLNPLPESLLSRPPRQWRTSHLNPRQQRPLARMKSARR